MILITGCAGYIGSEICKKFSSLNIDYVGIDNLSYSYKNNIYEKKKFYKICISDDKKVSQLIKKFKINFIIHAAAFAYVNDAEQNKKKYYKNNILNTKKFINNVVKENVKNFIFLSSSNVYTENSSRKKITELCATKPKNYYGKTKIIIEKVLSYKKNSFNNLIILRLFNVIGLTKNFKPKIFSKFKYQRFFFKIFFSISKKVPLELNYIIKKKNYKTFPYRDFVDVRDLVNLLVKFVKKKRNKDSYQVFNVGSGKSFSIKKITTLVEKTTNKKLNILYKKINSKEYLKTHSSIIKIKKINNLYPQISLKNSIKSYMRFLKF